MARVRAVAQGQDVHHLIRELPVDVATIIDRHAPVAALVNGFYVLCMAKAEARTTRATRSKPRWGDLDVAGA